MEQNQGNAKKKVKHKKLKEKIIIAQNIVLRIIFFPESKCIKRLSDIFTCKIIVIIILFKKTLCHTVS